VKLAQPQNLPHFSSTLFFPILKNNVIFILKSKLKNGVGGMGLGYSFTHVGFMVACNESFKYFLVQRIGWVGLDVESH
jgi:hypothetical protein